MRRFSASLAAKPVITEDGDVDIAGAVVTALAVAAIAADQDSIDAVTAIETAFGTSVGLKVFILGTPTKANAIAALEAVKKQILSSNLYS
jgi:hypothetical protein